MRLAGVFALVFTGGCSLLWNMDSYDAGPASSGREGGSSGGEDATSGGRADASPSSSSSGSPNDSGFEADAFDATPPCHDEQEPNDVEEQAHEVEPGTTCGSISTEDDEDNFKITTSNTIDITVVLPPPVEMIITGPTGGSFIDTPGTKKLTLPPGKTLLNVHSKTTGTGDYSIIR